MNYWKSLLRVILKKNSIIICLLFIFLCSFSRVDAEQPKQRKAVLVIINYTNLDEFAGMENINQIMQAGAIGLMNTRGASKTDNARAHASIGWGSRADVKIEHSYIETEKNALYLKDIDKIKEYNKANPYNARVGLLGDYLHSHGLTTSVIGSGGDQINPFVPGAFIAMDGEGMIDSGKIEEGLLKSDTGMDIQETDFNLLLNTFKEEYKNNNFIVVDTGDTSRYEQNIGIHKGFQITKESILEKIDDFIGDMLQSIDDKNTLLIILSPHYGVEDAKNGRRLCPVVLYGKGVSKGLLASDTTRRTGIVANIDIAPTIIKFFGDNPQNITGREMVVHEIENPLEKLFKTYNLTAFNYLNRTVVLKNYIAFQIILLIIILTFVLISVTNVMRCNSSEKTVDKTKNDKHLRIRWRNNRFLNNTSMILRILSIFVLCCPLTLLLIPITGITDLTIYITLLILMNSILVFLLYKIPMSQENRIIIISTATLSCILIDLLLSGSLNKTSLLGYDPIIGARYYGLGNEFMGILIASSLISITALSEKRYIPKTVATILFICIIPIIGLTIFGANVGGTIAATVAFGFAILRIFNKKITIKTILGIMFAVVFVVGIFAIYDLFFAAHKSHLAHALIEFKENGIDAIFYIIKRKLEMNIKLFKGTIWSQVLIVSIAVLGILFLKPRGMLHMLINKYDVFSTAWYSILIAGIVGMMVNDSGVVVAATSNIFLIFSLLYFLLGEKQDGVHRIGQNRN